MNLHNFPLTVGKTAIMHVLGEMCANRLPVRDLTIVTGRGRHIARDGKRGILRTHIAVYLQELGVKFSPSLNPGRISITASAINQWLSVQRADNKTTGAHRNLFLQVAFAKENKQHLINVRGVCPFSSAVIPPNSTNSSNVAATSPSL